MIKDRQKLEEFERRMLATENLTHEQAMAIFDSLFEEAVSLGVINDENILEGIETDIRVARILNQLK
ncbi:MAG: hypothetical protein JW749_01935 [Sedimentisphaerales bacterium]|nr:hypothetical protein [Sedimentisphaerales bacterium]